MARLRFLRGRTAARSRFAAACLLVLLRSWGGEPLAEQPSYHVRMWTTDDGLPHNSVGGVLQDSTGFLWLATLGGLARFDGREFREFRPPAANRALGFNIHGMAAERTGALLVVPTGGAVLRLVSEQWSVHPLTAILAERGEAASDLRVDAAGNIWVATERGRVVRWSPTAGGRWYGPDEGVGARSGGISFAEGTQGDMWIAGDALAVIDARGAVVPHGLSLRPRILGNGPRGRVLALTERRLLQLEGRRIAQDAECLLPAGAGTVHDLLQDEAGNVWIATTRHGLLRWQDGQTARINNLPAVLSIAADREGNLWAATDGHGIAQLREKSYRLFDSAAGLAQDVVSSLCEDAAGNVWLANRSGGLMQVTGPGEPQRRGPTGQRAFANVVMTDAAGRVWFGGGRNGLLRWDPRQPEALATLPAPRSDPHVLFRARDGAIWFAGEPGQVGFYRGDDPRLLSAEQGFSPQPIRTIAEDRAGRVWLGGRSGELLRWDGQRIERFDAARGFPREPIHALWIDSADRLWIGTANGLVLKDGDRFRVLTTAQGLADDIIQQILEDDQGCLWFAARRGLFYARLADLLAAARDPARRVECFRLGPSEGLVGLTPTANYQPGAAKTRDGHLWFATARGAVAIDPVRVPRDLPTPVVLIDEVHLDDRRLAPLAHLRLSSGQHRLEFRLAALSYTAPESVILRHRLEGADPGWVDTAADRTASYTNLPPKTYVLHAMARNSSGRWSAESPALTFTVEPRWWETLSFRLVVVALLAGLSAWSARIVAQRRFQRRLRRLEQEHALQKERARIARDLHDDLGAGLTELGLLADRLAEKPPRDLAPQLAGLAFRTRRLATELSRIVWTMNAANSSLDRLAGFLQRFAERVFRNSGISCVVTGTAGIPAIPLAPHPQHHLLAAAKEAMNNVLKHAGATEVALELRYAAGVFELRVADNGRGFDVAAASAAEGNGLRNMQSRLGEVGGSVAIASALRRGTTITLRLPCAAPPAST
jgi:signal transduction histidine kinase/ligand-binding sensor domain-containing protein